MSKAAKTTKSLTVVEAMKAALSRRRTGVTIDNLHEQAQKLAGRKFARVTVATQLLRNPDLFKREGRGLYLAA